MYFKKRFYHGKFWTYTKVDNVILNNHIRYPSLSSNSHQCLANPYLYSSYPYIILKHIPYTLPLHPEIIQDISLKDKGSCILLAVVRLFFKKIVTIHIPPFLSLLLLSNFYKLLAYFSSIPSFKIQENTHIDASSKCLNVCYYLSFTLSCGIIPWSRTELLWCSSFLSRFYLPLLQVRSPMPMW